MDDSIGLRAINKFLFQIIAATIVAVSLGASDISFHHYINGYFINLFISIVYIVGITNAINLIDGLDGLAGGVSIIISGAFLGLGILAGAQIGFIYLLVILLGALFSFLYYNLYRTQTFLGDTGSLFLGWIFAISSIVFSLKATFSLSILLPIMALGLPMFDVLLVMVKRFFMRHKYNTSVLKRFKTIIEPDNNHLHHLILSTGITKYKTVVIMYILTVITCIITIIAWFNRGSLNFYLSIILILFIVFLVRFLAEWRIKKNIE